MTYLIYENGRMVTAIDLKLPANARQDAYRRAAERHAHQLFKGNVRVSPVR